MTVVRRFLIASSLARLVSRQQGGTAITEGYFPPQQGRNSHLVTDGERCSLILVTDADGAPVEERTEVPRAHAEALLDVCTGTVSLERSRLALNGGGEALIERMTHPGRLDTITIEFDNPDEAAAFSAPLWFGPEITYDPSFTRHVMALNGVPEPQEMPLTNASLEALLDLIDGEMVEEEMELDAETAAVSARRTSPDSSVFDALRRLSASIQTSPQHATEPAEPRMNGSEPEMPSADWMSSFGRQGRPVPAKGDYPTRPRLFPRLSQ